MLDIEDIDDDFDPNNPDQVFEKTERVDEGRVKWLERVCDRESLIEESNQVKAFLDLYARLRARFPARRS